MNFDSLQDRELVNNFYNGGTGSLGSGPGPNFGVTFTDALAINEFAENEGLLVTPPNSIAFLSGMEACDAQGRLAVLSNVANRPAAAEAQRLAA